MACPCGCGARSLLAGFFQEERQIVGRKVIEAHAAETAKKMRDAAHAQIEADYKAMLARSRAWMATGRELEQRR